MSAPWLTILGIGDNGADSLTSAQKVLLDRAETVIAPQRVLDRLDLRGKKLEPWTGRLHETLDALVERRGQNTTILATGDPMYFGIGSTLAKRIPVEEMNIIPSPSAFSLAAARLGWALQHAECISLHGRPVELLVPFLAPGVHVIALTSDADTVNKVASLLCDAGYGASSVSVLEHMGSERERLVVSRADTLAGQSFADFNTMAIECRASGFIAGLGRLPGLPDNLFSHDGQMTKREVRAVALGLLRPFPGALLWDIGAGCGSISIEWMRGARGASAVAIEEQLQRSGYIAENALKLGVPNLKIVTGKAPDALTGIGQPDAVFCGGGITGEGVFETAWDVLKPHGVFVANAVTLEGEARLLQLRELHGGEMTRMAVSRAAPVGDLTGWRPLMPVTIWRVTK